MSGYFYKGHPERGHIILMTNVLKVDLKAPIVVRVPLCASSHCIFRKQGHPGPWRRPELCPLWARMLQRSPAPSSVRSSRSSTGTKASSAWTGPATTTRPRPNGRGSAAAVSTPTPGGPSCETSWKARGGEDVPGLGPMKALRGPDLYSNYSIPPICR